LKGYAGNPKMKGTHLAFWNLVRGKRPTYARTLNQKKSEKTKENSGNTPPWSVYPTWERTETYSTKPNPPGLTHIYSCASLKWGQMDEDFRAGDERTKRNGKNPFFGARKNITHHTFYRR